MAKVIDLNGRKVDPALVKSWIKEQLYVVDPSNPVSWSDVEFAIEDQFDGAVSEDQIKAIKEWIKSHPTLSKLVVFSDSDLDELEEETGEEREIAEIEDVVEKEEEAHEEPEPQPQNPKPKINIHLSRKEYKKMMAYMYQFHERLLANNPELDAVSTDSKYWRMVESEFGIERTNAPTWVRALITAVWKRNPENWKEEVIRKLEEYGFKVKLSSRKKREELNVEKERERYLNILRKAKERLESRLKEIEEEQKAIESRLREIEEEIKKVGG